MIPITPPTAEPVTVDAVKLALRLDDTAYDDLLPGLIAAARDQAQHITGRFFVQQTWRAELAAWPAACDIIAVHRATGAVVTFWDGAGWATLSSAGYVFAPNGNGTSLAPALGTAWPPLGDIAIGPRVRIDLTAGLEPASAGDTPDAIKTFITALVGQMIQSPELSATAAVETHPLLQRLLDPWRLYA